MQALFRNTTYGKGLAMHRIRTCLSTLGAAAMLVGALVASPTSVHAEGNKAVSNPQVEIVTNHGRMVVELEAGKTPKTVENFLRYVDDEFYDGTIFHRVISNFMIQGGGFDASMSQKKTQPPVVNEAKLGLKNDRGTIAMARTQDPNSATAQFFINVVDNAFLNYRNDSVQGIGYTAFGRVVEGMEVADRIAAVRTGVSQAGLMPMKDVPAEAVVIERVRRISTP